MNERDRALHFQALLHVGINQANRGEVLEDSDAFWDELDREVDVRTRRGDTARAEVLPDIHES